MESLKIADREVSREIIKHFSAHTKFYDHLRTLSTYVYRQSRNFLTENKLLTSGTTDSSASLRSSHKMPGDKLDLLKQHIHSRPQKPALSKETPHVDEYLTKRHIFNLNDLTSKCIRLDSKFAFKFQMSSVEDPFRFFVHVENDCVDEYHKMKKLLNDYYAKNEKSLASFADRVNYDFVRVNGICVARTNPNSVFFRALITNVEPYADRNARLVTVYFVDFGTCNRLSYANLFPINSEFLRLAEQCVMCELDSIVPMYKSWSAESIGMFKSLFKEKTYRALVVHNESRHVITTRLDKALSVIVESYDPLSNEYANLISFFVFNVQGEF